MAVALGLIASVRDITAQPKEALLYYWMALRLHHRDFLEARFQELTRLNPGVDPEGELQALCDAIDAPPAPPPRRSAHNVANAAPRGPREIHTWEDRQASLTTEMLPRKIRDEALRQSLTLGLSSADSLLEFARDLLVYRADKDAAVDQLLRWATTHQAGWWERASSSLDGFMAFRALGWFLRDIEIHQPGKGATLLLAEQEDMHASALATLDLSEERCRQIDATLTVFAAVVLD